MKLLNIDQLAEKLGWSKLYIYQLTSRKQIPHSKPGARTLRFDEEKIDKWLASKEVKLMKMPA